MVCSCVTSLVDELYSAQSFAVCSDTDEAQIWPRRDDELDKEWAHEQMFDRHYCKY